ncbi:TIGR04141 family sporadically distributed protein [Vibrio nigripulchritudo]|uniref:TIGR04141 family sporadically distributed protein n=1 Tax=Vibrio nigripulchritudo TaxID=28173 RepID=UPI00249050E8|nr:TIGR04141 family sporadically distributed protein [Vibrio nigripulchritudo]BDU40843.1 hypothetical protein TUMSATVNIG2_53120 [Vibrio nigripulchritudo]BDU46580.1 hypothetical protein TUMSATVNIG3_53780 [Vibrio nigripulchritudo]
MKKISTSIYLLKGSVSSNTAVMNTHDCIEHSLEIEGTEAKLFIKQPSSNKPAFADLFTQQPNFKEMDFGSNQSTGGVLQVQFAGNTFYLTFGHGYHLLDKDYFEPNFGLRVALNSTDIEEVRSVDTASNKAAPLNTRMQCGKGTKVNDFPIDVDEDMLQAIVGKSSEAIFNSQISGNRYALGIKLTADLKLLPTILTKAWQYFKAPLKPELKWVENIAEVTEDKLIDTLNNALVNALSQPTQNDFYLLEPEVVDLDLIAGYSYEKRSTQMFEMLSLSRYVKAATLNGKRALELSHLKTKCKIYAKDDNHQTVKTWSGLECIYGELVHNGEHFAIRNGVWYQMNKDFVKEVNDAIAQIPAYQYSLPDYDHKNEGAYNCDVAAQRTEIQSLDTKNIMLGGGKSRFEFCDLANSNNGTDSKFDLIHVKHYKNSSAELSHLFSQGVVSAEIFRSSAEARKKLYDSHPNVMPLSNSKQQPNANDYRVVFAIYGVKALPHKLPFFSKVNLRNAYNRLNLLGYHVALAHIQVSKNKLARSQCKPTGNKNAA